MKLKHFTIELGPITHFDYRWSNTHVHRPYKRTHVPSPILGIHTHTNTHLNYPITGAPRPGLQTQKPNLFIPVGIMGKGGAGGGLELWDEMHLTVRKAPFF